MRIDTFDKWLTEHGCSIDSHEQHGRSHGHPAVTIHREGRTARLTRGGAHEDLDPREVQRICDELGLDSSKLPGPTGRV